MSEEKELERRLYRIYLVADCSTSALVWGTSYVLYRDDNALHILDGQKTVANFASGRWIYIVDAKNQGTIADLKGILE